MASSKHQELMKKYAEVIVRVGLNLRRGQRLIITNSRLRGISLQAAPLAREVVRAAYEAGARYVDILWADEDLLRARLESTPRETLTEYPKWHTDALMDMVNHGDAMLTILADDPDLMNGL